MIKKLIYRILAILRIITGTSPIVMLVLRKETFMVKNQNIPGTEQSYEIIHLNCTQDKSIEIINTISDAFDESAANEIMEGINLN